MYFEGANWLFECLDATYKRKGGKGPSCLFGFWPQQLEELELPFPVMEKTLRGAGLSGQLKSTSEFWVLSLEIKSDMQVEMNRMY